MLHVLHLAAELSNALCGVMQATSVCGPTLGGAVCCMCFISQNTCKTKNGSPTLLVCCITAFLAYTQLVYLPHYCITALLHYCITALHYCTALLHYCSTALLYPAAILHCCNNALHALLLYTQPEARVCGLKLLV